MIEHISQIETAALEALNAATDTVGLEAWRVAHLGRNSPLMSVLGDLGQLPKEARPLIGQRGNQAKRALEDGYTARAEALRQAEMENSLRAGALDVTLPGRPLNRGRLHPAVQGLR